MSERRGSGATCSDVARAHGEPPIARSIHPLMSIPESASSESDEFSLFTNLIQYGPRTLCMMLSE